VPIYCVSGSVILACTAKSKFKDQFFVFVRVADPDPHRICIQGTAGLGSGFVFGMRIRVLMQVHNLDLLDEKK